MRKFTILMLGILHGLSSYAITDWSPWGVLHQVHCEYVVGGQPLQYSISTENTDLPSVGLIQGQSTDAAGLWKRPFHTERGTQTGKITIRPPEPSYTVTVDMAKDAQGRVLGNILECVTENVSFTLEDGSGEVRSLKHSIDINQYMSSRPMGSVWDVEVTIAKNNSVGWISKLVCHAAGDEPEKSYEFLQPEYLGGPAETADTAPSESSSAVSRRSIMKQDVTKAARGVGTVRMDSVIPPSQRTK